MNAFSEKFERVYRNLKDWRRNTEIEKSEYLEYAVKLWCKEVKIPQDIRSKINDSRNILTAFNKQWSNKRLINFFANNIQRSDIKGNETMSIYFFYTLIALMVIGVAYVIYQLNQPKSDDDLFETLEQDLSNEALQTIQKYRLILAIDPSKSSFLQNIKESNNFIRDESICENLFFATNYLWIGKESEDINLKIKIKKISTFTFWKLYSMNTSVVLRKMLRRLNDLKLLISSSIIKSLYLNG